MARLRTPRRGISLVCAAALSAAVMMQPAPAVAESNGAWWIPAVGASLLYTPIKVLTAVTGSILGAGAWLVLGGDDDAVEDIIIPSVRGDYWVEPDHLRGESHLDYMGR